MATRLDNALAGATLSDPERRTVQRLVDALEDALGDDLLASGSTAPVPAASSPTPSQTST